MMYIYLIKETLSDIIRNYRILSNLKKKKKTSNVIFTGHNHTVNTTLESAPGSKTNSLRN